MRTIFSYGSELATVFLVDRECMAGYETKTRCSVERVEAAALFARHSSGSRGTIGSRGDYEFVQGKE